MNQTEGQSRFAQAFERMPSALAQLRADINVQGVFAFPEEWKTLDETNPGIFTYVVRYHESELGGGKTVPRELTDKEKKEIEDQLAAKNAKKAPKKDSKQQQQEPQITPEQEEAIRRAKEAEELEEQRRVAEWNKLDEETKFYRTAEDRYKSPQILYEKGDFYFEREGQNMVIFEERVYADGGEWVFVVRQPTLGEEELAKFRKSKPKTMPNLNELFPIVMRGWVDYTSFRTQGATESIQRIRLTQFVDDQSPPDTCKPNLDGTYILLKLTLNNPVTPIRKEPNPTMQDVVALAPGAQPLHPSQQCIKELRAELELIMESLAMEYSNMFAKELNQFQEAKMNNMVLTHKKQDLQKRKEHFLYDFNVSGKYKILKERIKKSIVKICRDKFGKIGAITGITTGAEDQFYSDLYVFLMEEMRRLIVNLVRDKKEALLEDQLLLKEYAEKNIDVQLVQATNESKFNVLSRLADEYETLNRIPQANKHYKELMSLNPSDHASLNQYALFALRAGNFQNAEDLLEKALSFNNTNRDYQLLLAAVYLQRDHIKEATMIIRLLLEFDQDNILWNLVYYLLVSQVMPGDNQALARKIFFKCERLFLRQKGVLNFSGNHKDTPNIFDCPWIKIPMPPPDKPEKDKAVLERQEQQRIALELSHQQPKLTKDQFDELFLHLVAYLEEFNLLDLADKAAKIINNKALPQIVLLRAKVCAYRKDTEQAISIMDEYITNNPRAYAVLLAKGNLQYLGGKLEECKQTFLRALKLEEGKTNFSLYLRLGYLYLSKNQYGDARAFLTKACDQKPTSSLAWFGLGVACNKSQIYGEAQLALIQANTLEPHNGEILAYISLNAMQDGGRFEDANQALREMRKTDIDNIDLIARLSREYYRCGHNQTANQLMQQVLHLSDAQDLDAEQVTLFQMELAEIYYQLGQLQNAKELFQEILPRLQMRDQKQHVQEQIEKLEYQQLIQN